MRATAMSIEVKGGRSNAAHPRCSAYAGLLARGLACSRAEQRRSRRPDAMRRRRPPLYGGHRMIVPAPSFEAKGPRSNAAHPVGRVYARLLAREGLHAAALSKAATTALTWCTARRLLPEAAE
jgi:hypothetical protein